MNRPEKASQTISVALCTYNGEAYIRDQWQSLLQQTRLPNEVIVCDDTSSDNTVAILRQLAVDAPFRVRIQVNSTRLGFNKNFEQALTLCTGDLIFLCDQDDFWLPEKIEKVAAFMEQHPTIQVGFNNAMIADEELNSLDKFFWEYVRFDNAIQERWRAGEVMDILLEGNRVMGCATVVRKQFLPNFLPIPSYVPGYIYDGWIALVAATLGVIDFINAPLQIYRTHVSQQVGVKPSEDINRKPTTLIDRFIRQRDHKLMPLQEKFLQLQQIYQMIISKVPATAPGIPLLDRQLKHYKMRSTLSGNRLKRFLPVMTSLWQGNYHRYADSMNNWYAPYLAALGDMLE